MARKIDPLAAGIEKHAQAYSDKTIGVGELGMGPFIVESGHLGEESVEDLKNKFIRWN